MTVEELAKKRKRWRDAVVAVEKAEAKLDKATRDLAKKRGDERAAVIELQLAAARERSRVEATA